MVDRIEKNVSNTSSYTQSAVRDLQKSNAYGRNNRCPSTPFANPPAAPHLSSTLVSSPLTISMHDPQEKDVLHRLAGALPDLVRAPRLPLARTSTPLALSRLASCVELTAACLCVVAALCSGP